MQAFSWSSPTGRCLPVLSDVFGVLNTVTWMEGVILIPERIMSRKGVNVFSRFGGGGINIFPFDMNGKM